MLSANSRIAGLLCIGLLAGCNKAEPTATSSDTNAALAAATSDTKSKTKGATGTADAKTKQATLKKTTATPQSTVDDLASQLAQIDRRKLPKGPVGAALNLKLTAVNHDIEVVAKDLAKRSPKLLKDLDQLGRDVNAVRTLARRTKLEKQAERMVATFQVLRSHVGDSAVFEKNKKSAAQLASAKKLTKSATTMKATLKSRVLKAKGATPAVRDAARDALRKLELLEQIAVEDAESYARAVYLAQSIGYELAALKGLAHATKLPTIQTLPGWVVPAATLTVGAWDWLDEPFDVVDVPEDYPCDADDDVDFDGVPDDFDLDDDGDGTFDDVDLDDDGDGTDDSAEPADDDDDMLDEIPEPDDLDDVGGIDGDDVDAVGQDDDDGPAIANDEDDDGPAANAAAADDHDEPALPAPGNDADDGDDAPDAPAPGGADDDDGDDAPAQRSL